MTADTFDLNPYQTQRLPWAVGVSTPDDLSLNSSLSQQMVTAHLQDRVRTAAMMLARLPELEMRLILTHPSPGERAGRRDVLFYHHPLKNDDKYIIAPRDADALLRLYPSTIPQNREVQIEDIYTNDREGITGITLDSGRRYIVCTEADRLPFYLEFLAGNMDNAPCIVPIPFHFYRSWRQLAGLKVRE